MKKKNEFLRRECRTRRLVLRPLYKKDYQIFLEAYSKGPPKQNRWDLEPRTVENCSRKIFHALLLRHEELAEKDDWYWFGIIEKKSGRLIGHIDFDVFVRSTHQFANFGYQIYNRHWGKGYGQEAAKAALKIGFRDLKLNRLEAAINLDNKKSIRLVKAIGMHREGIKKRYWFEFGAWVDHLIYVANPEDIGMKARNPFRVSPPSPKQNR